MFETKLIKCFSCQVHSSYLGLNFLIFFYFFVTFAIFYSFVRHVIITKEQYRTSAGTSAPSLEVFLFCFFHFSFWVVFIQTSMFSRGGRWDFRFWPFFMSVFRFRCPLRFPVFPFFSIWFFGFLAKINQVRFLFWALCSQMLGYLICFYFTVNSGQTAMWDSGFFYQRFKAIVEPRTVLKRKLV